MPIMPPPSSTMATAPLMQLKPRVSERTSIHGELLERMAPEWLISATPARRHAIKQASTFSPDWYQRASSAQQQVLKECFSTSFTSQTRLDKAMSALQDIDTFAELLLSNALKDQFRVEVDVSKTLLCLRRPLEISDLEIEVSHFEVFKLSLLQAALHNFEASECEAEAFHKASGFLIETSTPGIYQPVTVGVTVRQFLTLCRNLDIGAKYQTYVKVFFQAAETTLRQQFMTSQKEAMRAAAELALLKKDIERKDYEMILSVIDGNIHPWQGNKQVWFRDLSLMKRRMTGCVVFAISEKYHYTDEFIVYIPHDPQHPLKRYTTSQLREVFKRQFTARDTAPSGGDGPTAYQRFFSQFVAYADRPYYFSQFTRKAADAPADPLHSVWLKVAQFLPPFSSIARIKELPPERQGAREPVEDPYLNPFGILQKGGGLWSDNTDLWTYLYEQSREKVIADARSHAVPTADVDARVRAQKLSHLLEVGMLALNMVSMFVPVLGEVMMTVMAGQLLYETFEGAIEWSEGDRDAAKAHLIDVAQNLAMIGVMAGVGKGLGKLMAVKPEPVIECLEPIKRPNGQTRLWKPDLDAYEYDITLDSNSAADALGQHRVNGKTYIRQTGKVYETIYDEPLKKWRIQHPTDADAYQPILEHNGYGAWRHTLERPLEWDRLTLLRRMGHVTEALTDEQLLKIADAVGINDNALRKMHLDHLPPPPELADALRLFAADHGAAQVSAQISGELFTGMLQRACPGLSESAAHRVLLDANAEELARLETTRRIPLKMLEEARWHAQQGRVSRAFVGLHLEHMASVDSQWLALRALEKLPGWSDEVRLEMRDGYINGPLIDGIGSESAANFTYVVKKGPVYQAFDERGNALNGVPSSGDNFFASIMHALPDESRQALGVPRVSQCADLQSAVIDSATRHHVELAHRLKKRIGSNKVFKRPVRVNDGLVGYYASGRGQAVNPMLVTRVRDVYPALTDQQANGFILRQLRAGKTDAQIYDLLQARRHEWEALESTLDQWVGEPIADVLLRSMLGGRASVARSIKECWRYSPLAEGSTHFSSLDLICDDPLPSLSADFSHVRDLHVRGRCVTDANIDALLGRFPKLKKLRINATGNEFSNVPEALSGMQELTGLSLYSAAPYAVDMPTRLSTLTSLEELSIYSSGYTPMVLDVSRLRNLHKLEIIAPSLFQWPAGILELPHLERLNLKGTGIRALPDAMYEGHERLWSGLSLDWSNFPRDNFKLAYEYVKQHPEHLIDLEEMVSDYCKGELRRLGEGGRQSSSAMFNRFVEQWQGAQERFEAMDALSEEYGVLDRQLNGWTGRAMQRQLDVAEVIQRSMATVSIRTCWRNGVFKRYGSTADASVLDLSNLQVEELPELPSGAFSHVQTLYMKGVQATAEQVRGFVRGFTELQTLDLSASGLTEVPIAPGDLAKLKRVDLSGNRIMVEPAVQQCIDGLQSLEYLDLSHNPLNVLDVSAMSRLKALNLGATDLHEWPTGAHDLPELTWLDVRDSQISSLPEAVLEDEMLIKTNLTGTPLTPQAQAALEAAWQRLEIAKGLPAGTLGKFAQEAVPPFPPSESGFSLARHLLALPQAPVGEGAAYFAKRLQRLNPTLTDDQAWQAIELLRRRGATDIQISERMTEWDQTFETLTRELNGWLYTRESRGADWRVSSDTRRLAALRILESWREGLIGNGIASPVLNLNGLQLGDLPKLPAVFAHVSTLNLTGVRLSAQGSDGFLKAFTHVKTLKLNGNELPAVPEPIQHMAQLERLELSENRLDDAEHLYDSLSHHEHLKWLDLSYNKLESFDVGFFERLVMLDLRNNNLTEWPQGVLNASALETLNLSGNDITTIPSQGLDGSHDALMSGTDLSDNYNLSLESLERLRVYRDTGDRGSILGFSRSELDDWIADATGEGWSDSASESVESDEILPDVTPDTAQQAPWLANVPPDELATKNQIWNQLAAEPDNGAFFHLLSRLQDTREFSVANADLTRRVWTVIEAAASNTELRETVFASSNTHGTCVDGRILTFSGLESKVFTHNALLEIPVGRQGMKGAALLKLSRRLFRLDKVDNLATKAAARTGHDEAEVRLGYRIGLTQGWGDGLDLPGQPKHMTYASGVTPGQLAEARIEVMSAEQGDGFFEELIQRDYWVDYLKEKYPDEFRKLDEAQEIEDESDDSAFMSKLFDLAAARNGKMIELSRKEVREIEASASSAGQSGTSKRLTEPSNA